MMTTSVYKYYYDPEMFKPLTISNVLFSCRVYTNIWMLAVHVQ